MKIYTLTCLMVVLALLGAGAYAQGLSPFVSIDEYGNGSITVSSLGTLSFQGFLAPDPFPGGSANALTYQAPLAFQYVVGDVLCYEQSNPNVLSDVLRFNPNGQLVVYSDNSQGVDSLADAGIPPIIQPFHAIVFETTVGLNSFVDYTPSQGQPGFVFAPTGYSMTYHFISDSGPTTAAVPELPAPLLGSICGLCGLLWKRMK